MTKLLSKNMLLIIFAGLVLLLMGMVDIDRYSYYGVPSLNNEMVNDEEVYTKIISQISNDEDCSCRITVDYYKAENGIKDYDLYTVLITIEVDQEDDISYEVVRNFDSIESVTVRSDLDTYQTGYLLVDYMMADWSNHQKGWDISFSIKNLIGKKDISKSSNHVGYMHSDSNSVIGFYNGEFEYQDYTKNSKIQSKFSVAIPKGEVVDISVEYKIEMKNTNLYLFSFNSNEVIGEWKELGLSFGN